MEAVNRPMSPESTPLGAENLAAEIRTPVVPPLTEPELRKAP